MSSNSLQEQKEESVEQAPSSVLYPTQEELAVLSTMERRAFKFVHAMNQPWIKWFWTWCQKIFGALWINICTYNLMTLYGIEKMKEFDNSRPLLIVSNHRSFFDMYVVSAMLYKHTKWKKQLYFPVRARFFYQGPLGMFVNLVMGFWSMYPPFFYDPKKKVFDQYSTRLLLHLCKYGVGHVIGFHPEGTRNKDSDPYTFLPAQPGVGKIIKDAQPQVLPVFIAGLRPDNLKKQVFGNWTGGPKIRIHFGNLLDMSKFYEMKNQPRTYKMIADYVMSEVAKLAEYDRSIYAPETVEKISQNEQNEKDNI